MHTGATLARAALPAAPRPAEQLGIAAARAARERLAWLGLGALGAAAIFALSRPYRGIVHDAVLYVGRASADADPGGLGRDILFANDGQFGFTIFPRLMTVLVAQFGASAASVVVTAAGLAIWFLAAAAFASRLSSGRVLWASLVTLAVLPSHYGGYTIVRYAEQFATARPLAEAAVLAGFAALMFGRPRLGLAALLIGAAVHPIMAAPGLAVWLLVQCALDRRWIVATAAGAALLAAAALLDLPLANRLVLVFDAEWREAVASNAYLYPSRWSRESWAVIVVHVATIGLALPHLADRRARLAIGAILAAGIGGVAITYLLADVVIVALVIQVQAWRTLWLVSVAAALTLPIVAVHLWRIGPAGRVALAVLAFAWMAASVPGASMAASVAAIALALVARRRAALFGTRVALAAWIAVAAYGLVFWTPRAIFAAGLFAAKPAGAALLADLWLFWVFSLPFAAAAIAWAIADRWRPSPYAAAALVAALLGTAVATADDRPALYRRFDDRVPDADLVALLPPGRGEILWLRNGGPQAWARAGRPNWISYVQGASMIFSRELSGLWLARMNRLIAANLADEGDRLPHVSGTRIVLHPSLADIAGFCAAPDGPVALIVPLDGTTILPDGLPVAIYTSRWPEYEATEIDGRPGWVATDRYAVVNCLDFRKPAQLRATL